MVRRRFSKLIDLRHRSGNIILVHHVFDFEVNDAVICSFGWGLSVPSQTLDLSQSQRQAIEVGGLAHGRGRRHVDLSRGPLMAICSTRTPASKATIPAQPASELRWSAPPGPPRGPGPGPVQQQASGRVRG